MLNDIERARFRELYALVELSNASPEEFEELQALKKKDNAPIFVFGSNELGLHGGGAAFVAKRDHGARYARKGGPGQGFGPQGNSFAIPTCSTTTNEHNHKITLEKITFYVDCFIMYTHRHPELQFQVTQIGCGLAGWTKEQIAPLFLDAPDNCSFDTDWKPILGGDAFTPRGEVRERKYWGHVG